MLISCSLSGSLVMQWRFVNRVQKQMTAFKEVTIIWYIYWKIIDTINKDKKRLKNGHISVF